MAKATPQGSSIWLPAGADAPPGTPDEVLLTGPGGAAAMERRRLARQAAPGGSADDARQDRQGSEAAPAGANPDGLSMEADDLPERPAGNARTEAWREYVAKLEGQDPDAVRYDGLSRDQLKERSEGILAERHARAGQAGPVDAEQTGTTADADGLASDGTADPDQPTGDPTDTADSDRDSSRAGAQDSDDRDGQSVGFPKHHER